jgi:hypothetical protein
MWYYSFLTSDFSFVGWKMGVEGLEGCWRILLARFA